MDALDEQLRRMDARLSMLQNEMQISRLKTEISLLEEQCQSLAETSVQIKQEPERGVKGQVKFEKRPKNRAGNEGPPLLTPILKHEDRFENSEVRVRNRVPSGPFTSTPRRTLHGGFDHDINQSTEISCVLKMKPATYDGTSSWDDYRKHFEACSRINAWTKEEQGLYLSVSLRGQAQGILGNLGEDSYDFDRLMSALTQRFAPPNQAELHRTQLRERRQKASETLSELAQDILRLTNLAYPSAPVDVRDVLAKEQFIDSLVSSDMKLRIKQARPHDLNDAVRHALELDAFLRSEKKMSQVRGNLYTMSGIKTSGLDLVVSEIRQLKQDISELRNGLERLKNSHKNSPATQTKRRGLRNKSEEAVSKQKDIGGSKYHVKRNCPNVPESNRTKGHLSYGMKSSERRGSGLFIEARINKLSFDFQIDTGATVSVVSRRVLKMLKHKFDTESCKPVIIAPGSSIDVLGTSQIEIEIGSSKFPAHMIVADIEADGILGLDFMQVYSGIVDLGSQSLMLNGKAHKLYTSGRIDCVQQTKKSISRLEYKRTASEAKKQPCMRHFVHSGTRPRIDNSDSRKRRLGCMYCRSTFKKSVYLKKHVKKFHCDTSGPCKADQGPSYCEPAFSVQEFEKRGEQDNLVKGRSYEKPLPKILERSQTFDRSETGLDKPARCSGVTIIQHQDAFLRKNEPSAKANGTEGLTKASKKWKRNRS